MSKRVLLGLVGGGLLLGAGGWAAWTAHQHALQRLRQTEATLSHKQDALKALEEEHQKLTESYDTLKERWADTDKQFQQLSQSSAEMTKQMATLTSERSEVQRQLEDTKGQQQQLLGQLHTFEQRLTNLSTEKSALESQLANVTTHSLTPLEAEQLAEAFSQSTEAQDQLHDRLSTLSRTVEQLTQDQEQLEAQVMGRRGASHEQLAHYPNAQQLAKIYKDLGVSYLATYQYAKAADVLERSLVFQDDPDVHSKLAFLYSRLLHNRRKAEQHLALASSSDPTVGTLGGAASAYGLPRSDWQLFWQWLTQ